jgi:hypothetical protein
MKEDPPKSEFIVMRRADSSSFTDFGIELAAEIQ